MRFRTLSPLAASLAWVVLASCSGGAAETPRPAPIPDPPADTTPASDPPPVVFPRPRDTVRIPEPGDTVPDPLPEPVEPEPEEPEEPEMHPAMAEPIPVLPGAVLPRRRIVAFYGNPASTRMGILGELPPEAMLARLDQEVARWEDADPTTPVVPALHLIAAMATGDPGADSLYRLRMPSHRIEQVLEWAERRNALVFLDIQPGRGPVLPEVERLEPWLRRPDVHLALDPEWRMGPDERPGRSIGSMAVEEINEAVDFLAELVEDEGLPPKVLVVHRFTSHMIRDAEDIALDPRVQVVVNMDGWGPPEQKIETYRAVVAPEATQFTGFKLFFKNDVRGGSRMLSPGEILALAPVPIYIQYQ